MSTETTTTKLMTAEEFCDWVHRPENTNKWFELVRGEVIELPPPQKLHGVVCSNLGRHLGNYAEEKGWGYVTNNDAGVILERDPDTVRGPDVAFYTDAETLEELHPKYGEVPPIVAVEVLSPNDLARTVMRKIRDYLKGGVKLVWVVDPEDRQVTAYRADAPPVVFSGDQDLAADDILPGFTCSLRKVFRLPSQKPSPPLPPRGKRRKRR